MDPIEQQLRIAMEHHQRGELPQAERIYRAILASNPNQPDALHRLGLIAAACNRPEDAAKLIERSIVIAPTVAEYHINLGMLRLQNGQRNDALASFDRALTLVPKDLSSLAMLGGVLKDLGRIDDALKCCAWMIQIDPNWAPAHANQGIALAELRRYDEAIESLHRAIALQPNYLDAINALGLILNERGRCDEAADMHTRAAALQPDSHEHVSNLGGVLIAQGKIPEAIAFYRDAMARGIRNSVLHDNLLLALNLDERANPEEIANEHRQWAAEYERPLLMHPAARHDNDRDPQRKLRVAYHGMFDRLTPIDMLLERAICSHDRDSVELHLYHESSRILPGAQWINTRADAVRLTLGLTDDAFAQMVRHDKIDILIDLCGHTAHHRLLALARRPAPVQMTYLGYCNTTGMESIDYLISDAIVDPPEFEPRYSEKVIRLPGGFTGFSPPADAPEPNALPALATGTITFGSTHGLGKANRRMIRMWASALHEIPNSRLLIVRHTLTGSALARLRGWLVEEQIDPSRFELRSEMPPRGHYWLYHEIDVCLDTQPWSGHVTACQSMWMGVPMITMLGAMRAGRMAASVLHQIGRTEWIAADVRAYIEIAKQLAANLPALAAIRTRLREQIASSILCDGRRLAAELEQAYRVAWKRLCDAGR